ncbi:MAG TPA: hypothetical protein V6C57_27575, partial [Coleofasciculaceae cyanobacterium]
NVYAPHFIFHQIMGINYSLLNGVLTACLLPLLAGRLRRSQRLFELTHHPGEFRKSLGQKPNVAVDRHPDQVGLLWFLP